MRFCVGILCAFLVMGCGSKNDTPKAPEASLLVFPLQNSECTTGETLNATISQVEFQWQASNNTTEYELRATNLLTGITQTISSETTSAKLPLEKGAPYSWIVNSRNDGSNETATSDTWQFYNAGARTTYAPFPAGIIAPKSGASVAMDINNEVLLIWEGADVDNDIASYELYFSTANPPLTLIASPSVAQTSFTVSVSANNTYYWKVITKDVEGNTSDSGVFEFRVL